MSSAWDILAEDFFGHTGMAGHSDDSGVRGRGLYRPLIRRQGNFPYDRTDPDQTYGNPQTYDRGSNMGGAMHQPLTPKDIGDGDAELMGLKKDKFRKLTDEELDEVLGSPMLLGKANSSNLIQGIPGVGSGWAKNPPKDWDKDPIADMDEEQIQRLYNSIVMRDPHLTRESPLNIDTSPPDIESVPNPGQAYELDQSDSDLERRLSLLGIGKHDIQVVAPDPWAAVIGGRMTSRGLYGLMPKESSWDTLKAVFVGRDRD